MKVVKRPDRPDPFDALNDIGSEWWLDIVQALAFCRFYRLTVGVVPLHNRFGEPL